MKTINGLMVKDLYVFKNYRGNIIFSFIMFTFLITLAAFRMDIVAPGGIVFLIFFGMNSISTFSYDENALADKYLLSLPISRKDIVYSKYLFAFINSLLSILVGIGVSLIIMLLIKGKVEDLGDSLRLCFMAFTSVSFLMCADIPCIYKWGVEKGRMQSVLVPILLIFIFGIIGSLVLFLFPSLYSLLNLNALFYISPLICLMLNIIFYYISFKISYHIFKKKEL